MFQIKWLWKNFKGARGKFILGIIFTLTYCGLCAINPRLSQIIVDRIIVGHVNEYGETVREMQLLVPLALTMLAVTVGCQGTLYAGCMLTDIASQNFIYKMRVRLYENMQNQDMGFFDLYRTGDIMTRLTGDMDMVRHSISYVFREVLQCTALFLMGTIMSFTINARYALCLMIVTPFIFLLSSFYIRKIRPYYVRVRNALSALNTCAQENIDGNRVIKAFASEEFEKKKFSEKNRDFYDLNLETNLVWMKFFPVIQMAAQYMDIISVLCGGIFLIKGWMTAGELSAFTLLTWSISSPMSTLGVLLNDFQRFFASVDKIIEIYYQCPTIQNKDDGLILDKDFEGHIRFEDVTFRFKGETVLEHISFEIEPGQTVAIMGETGCGKTTIINLLERFYDVKEGRITLDGIDIRRWNLQSLRSKFGVATQEVFLFSDTVEGNIAYGSDDISMERVKSSAATAQVDFINRLPEGYDTIIGERGVGLSGGQRQRLALARALAIQPPILVLDDTTSAVDTETEELIQQGLDSLDFPCTKIIIAQRISSVKNADKIIVLRDKHIIESGTHEELLKNNGYYCEINRIQNGIEGYELGEELDLPLKAEVEYVQK